MNDEFIKQVRIHMDYNLGGISQTKLAKKVGVSKQYLNRVLNGHDGKMPDVWKGILEEVGMELMPIPKSKVIDVKKVLVE